MTGFYVFLALAAAGIGALPTLAAGRIGAAVGLWAAGSALTLAVAYLATPETVTPFMGAFGLMAFLGFVAGAVLSGVREAETAVALNVVAAVLWAAAFVATSLWGSSMFHAAEYAALAGKVDTRDWTADVQPKDPRHMRLVPLETARYLARKATAQDGAIGSQFSLGEGVISPQVVDGRLTYVIPLEFNGIGAWSSTEGSPGWIEVDAEDPSAQPRFVKAPAPLRVMEGAFLGDDLERTARAAGVREEIVGRRFKLDAAHRPTWILSLAHPLVGNGGTVLDGVALVDPATGAVERHGMGDLPDVVDVAYPHEVVNEYLADRGELSGGWLNSMFSGAGLTRPEATRLVAGNGGGIVWVTGMTSANDKDDSLVSLDYADPRSGHVTTYVTKGGGTESAATKAADANQDIVMRRLTATMPQVYNVDGVQTVVMSLLNGADGFQGVAFSEMSDVSDVAWGPDAGTAADAYRAMLARKGRGADVGKPVEAKRVEGVVDRIASVAGGRDYEFSLVGSDRLYVASSVGFPRLVLTRPGDEVAFGTTPTGAEVSPAIGFANATMSAHPAAPSAPPSGDGDR